MTRAAEAEAPVFIRTVYDANMKRVRRGVKACRCSQPVAKTNAEHTTCGNCGGAILTARERQYLKAVGGK